MANIVTEESACKPGAWYALAIADEEGVLDWGGARLLKYAGEGVWLDEDGSEVERLWDPLLQAWVAPGAADAFAIQGVA